MSTVMAEPLAVPVQLDGCSQSVQNRCSSPQPRHETTIPRTSLDDYDYDSYTPHNLSPDTSTTSSIQLSSISYCLQSSWSLPSMSSSIYLETRPIRDDSLFFPIYDFGKLSPSPSPKPLPSSTAEVDTDCPRLKSSTEPIISNCSGFLGKAADDTFLRREPSRHVDYLSHDWQEEDIWASWRYMVGNRKVHGNATRLENASWRTWAQKMNHLRTVSADKLNWMKDCDVTWLYGPLSIGKDKISPSPSPADTKLQSYKTKPILKKRSISEVMLQKSLSTSSLLKQATAVIESQESIHLYPPSRPDIVAHANSTNSSLSCRSNLSSLLNTSDITSAYSTGWQSPATKRHIHFNDQVQQCIALETGDSDYMYENIYREQTDSYNEEKKLAEPNFVRNGFERGIYNEPQTIAHLPSTTLKFNDEPLKRKGYSLNSIFAASKLHSTSLPLPTYSLAGGRYSPEYDQGMADLDWEPNRRFSNRQIYIPTTPSPQDGTTSLNLEVDSFQLPNFNSWDDENPCTAGLLERAVDAVNTARDIAHVLWNVGWRR